MAFRHRLSRGSADYGSCRGSFTPGRKPPTRSSSNISQADGAERATRDRLWRGSARRREPTGVEVDRHGDPKRVWLGHRQGELQPYR